MMILTLGPGDLSAKIKIATLIIYSRRLLNGRARCLGNRKKKTKEKEEEEEDEKKKETTTTTRGAPLNRDPPIFSLRRRRPIIFPPLVGQSQPPTREACLAIWIIPMRVQLEEEEEKSDISPLFCWPTMRTPIMIAIGSSTAIPFHPATENLHL